MKRTFILLLVFALAQVSFAQLSGPLSGTLGPGYYSVVATIYVNASDSLRIMPGTTLYFVGPFPFYILGKLTAVGTRNDSIIFTSAPTPNANRWRGLRFDGVGSSGSQLAYCLIENGFAIGAEPNDMGGGVYCDWSSPSIAHCTFRNSKATRGGGIGCYRACPSITNCIFSGNIANGGGGMYCLDNSSPCLFNCIFCDDTASYGGGGVYCCDYCSPLIANCIFTGNRVTSANSKGAAIYCLRYSSRSINHCTIAANSAYGGGCGGVYCTEYSSPTIKNCIIWGNTGSQVGSYYASPTVTYSDIQGGYSGIGNINADPAFVQGPDGPYYLSQIIAGQGVQSPCVDAGDLSSPVIEGATRTDLVQDAWPVDMGYHYQANSPTPFALISPQWGDTCWTLDTLLVWQAAIDLDPNDTVRYEVWLDTLSNLSTAREVASALSDTTFALGALADNNRYYWTVHASDLNTPGTWASDTLMFRTYRPEPPQSFALAEPPNGDTVHTSTPTLRWRRAVDPDPGDVIRYHLMWSYNSDFSVYEDTTVGDTKLHFSGRCSLEWGILRWKKGNTPLIPPASRGELEISPRLHCAHRIGQWGGKVVY